MMMGIGGLEMKLTGKIMTLVVLPIVLFGAIVFATCAIKITDMTNEIIKNDLHASALSGRSMICNSGGQLDAFRIDGAGNMYNGEKNLTMNVGNADAIKKASGIDTTIYYGDTRRMSTIKNPNGRLGREVGTQATGIVLEKVLGNGEEYFSQNIDINGVKYYGYYLPLYNSLAKDKPVGMFFSGKASATVQHDLYVILGTILGVTLVLIVISIAAALFCIRKISKRIAYGVKVVEQVSEGRLGIELDHKMINSHDEIGEILRAISRLKDSLYGIVDDILKLSGRVKEASDTMQSQADRSAKHIAQVDNAVTGIADGATAQAEETQNTTDNVVRMGDMLEKNNVEVTSLNENAQHMTKTSNEAIDTLNELESINEKTRRAVEVIAEQTNTTNDSSLKIREAINLITDIAEETNLLSLNASIEAARAGEQGRGFAVVAGQIQKLAEQSNESAHKIEDIVASLIEDSHKAVDTMEEVKKIIDEQSGMVTKTSEMFDELKAGIDHSVSGVNVIADSTQVIESARTNVVEAVQNLTSIAEENAASTQETAAAVSEISEIVQSMASDSEKLRQISVELEGKIEFFKLQEDVEVPEGDSAEGSVEESPAAAEEETAEE